MELYLSIFSSCVNNFIATFVLQLYFKILNCEVVKVYHKTKMPSDRDPESLDDCYVHAEKTEGDNTW